MREVDRRTIEEVGLPGVVLMENAGAGVTQHLKRRFPAWRHRPILIVAGPGNNGGDGFVVARRLKQSGARVSVFLLGACGAVRGDALRHLNVFQKIGGDIQALDARTPLTHFSTQLAQAGMVVDAVFGTGLTRSVTGLAATLFKMINDAGKPVLAVDIPSGVSADSGQLLGIALQASWTVTFAAEKRGHRLYPGAALCGEEVACIDIGIPASFVDQPEHAVARNRIEDIIAPPRPLDAHKGSCGHLLILAGALGKEGAAVLTALGALRTGPGLVTVLTPHTAQPGVASKLTEAMTWPFLEQVSQAGLLSTLQHNPMQPAALALGPGLGTQPWTRGALNTLLSRFDVPAVLDADALNVAASIEDAPPFSTWIEQRQAAMVVTPHPGEFARLVRQSIAEVQKDRLGQAMKAAEAWRVWVVLKGAGTVIAAPDGRAWINDTGNAGMASGGSGDLLTGIVAGLLTQGWPVEHAVRAGVWLHGAAADAAAQEGGQDGLLASDLLPHVRRLRSEQF